MRRPSEVAYAVLLSSAALACGDSTDGPGGDSPLMKSPVPAAAAEAAAVPAVLEGRWLVARAFTPGVSALSEAEAMRWVGREASFTNDSARFGDAACAAPVYAMRRTSVRELEERFRLPASALELSGDSTTIYSVVCHGGGLDAGREWYPIHPDSMITVWDGAFFVLGRLR